MIEVFKTHLVRIGLPANRMEESFWCSCEANRLTTLEPPDFAFTPIKFGSRSNFPACRAAGGMVLINCDANGN